MFTREAAFSCCHQKVQTKFAFGRMLSVYVLRISLNKTLFYSCTHQLYVVMLLLLPLLLLPLLVYFLLAQ